MVSLKIGCRLFWHSGSLAGSSTIFPVIEPSGWYQFNPGDVSALDCDANRIRLKPGQDKSLLLLAAWPEILELLTSIHRQRVRKQRTLLAREFGRRRRLALHVTDLGYRHPPVWPCNLIDPLMA